MMFTKMIRKGVITMHCYNLSYSFKKKLILRFLCFIRKDLSFFLVS